MKDGLKVFGAPILLAAITAFGLVACLWGGAGWQWASWIALAIPLAVIGLRLVRSKG